MFDPDIEYRDVDSTKMVPLEQDVHTEISYMSTDSGRPIKQITDKLIRESPTLQQRLSPKEETELELLEDGTELRHRFSDGIYDGTVVKATVINGKIVYGGNTHSSPSPAANKADEDIRGDDASNHNGWDWWKFENNDGEWVKLDELR